MSIRKLWPEALVALVLLVYAAFTGGWLLCLLLAAALAVVTLTPATDSDLS